MTMPLGTGTLVNACARPLPPLLTVLCLRRPFLPYAIKPNSTGYFYPQSTHRTRLYICILISYTHMYNIICGAIVLSSLSPPSVFASESAVFSRHTVVHQETMRLASSYLRTNIIVIDVDTADSGIGSVLVVGRPTRI